MLLVQIIFKVMIQSVVSVNLRNAKSKGRLNHKSLPENLPATLLACTATLQASSPPKKKSEENSMKCKTPVSRPSPPQG